MLIFIYIFTFQFTFLHFSFILIYRGYALIKSNAEDTMKRKRITIEEVAAEANVSIATVSRIINNKGNVKKTTRDHVIETMQRLDFHPQNLHPLSDPSSNTILTCVPDFCNPFNSPVIDGIQKAAHENNYDVLLLQSKDYYTEISDFSNILKEKSIAGILILSSVSNNALLDELSFKCPIVMCSEYAENYGVSYISINDVTSSMTAVNYLISTGCRKIGLMNSSPKFKYARHREKGFFLAMNEHGLETNNAWISHISSINYNLAYSTALHILQLKNRPDAMFACSDVFGIAIVNAAKKLGLRVPEDLSVVGFDNIDVSLMSDPPLTTIDQPKFQLGYQAGELLINKIKSPDTIDKQIILNTELIIRGSTRLPSKML